MKTKESKKANKKKKVELVKGNLIREIEVNKDHHKFFFKIELALSNLILLCMVILLVIKLDSWWISVVGALILISAMIFSAITIKNSPKMIKYTLYENALHVETISINHLIDLATIISVRAKSSLFDKMLKQANHTIVIHTNFKKINKIELYLINENVNELCKTILNQVEKAKEINNQLDTFTD